MVTRIEFRLMTEADIRLGMGLKAQAHWNQTEADWQRFLRLQPDGCFVARCNGQDVGTTTVCMFGSVAWIAMVLVDIEHRHRGIGTRLVQHALNFLDRHCVATVRLDATASGRPVYERLGFVAQYELMRMAGEISDDGVPWLPRPADLQRIEEMAEGKARVHAIEPMGQRGLDAIERWDRLATRTPRGKLLARLIAESASRGYLTTGPDNTGGYVLSRWGAQAVQLGPAVASDEVCGRVLLDRAAADWAGQRVYIDVPVDNHAAVRWAEDRGLAYQRSFVRMVRGQPVSDDLQLLWASSGPEKG